jgi:hypothetical protein
MEKRSPFTRALRALALPALAALVLGACAAPSRTGPEAAAPGPAAAPATLPALVPTVPPADLDSTQRFAWQQTVQLGEAFAAGDADGFLARVSRGFYRGYARLESSLKKLLGDSSERAAVVAVQRISEESGKISVRAEWTRSVTRRDGRVEARSGRTEFIFLKSDTSLRLIDYRGDAPFAIEGI